MGFDRFMTANRSVKTGLTASAVVSVCLGSDNRYEFRLTIAVMALEHGNAWIVQAS